MPFFLWTKRLHPRSRRQSERGAILVLVATALLVLLAFSGLVISNGVRLVSRGQAQHAADAGAMAAAGYLAWGDPTDLSTARAIGVALAQQNFVWGAPPDVTPADVTFPTCPPGALGPVDMCVRVDVFRNQRAGGNPLPVYFMNLFGIVAQGIRATATAQVLFGDGPGPSDCLKPFAIPDRWGEMREDEAGTPPADDDGSNLPNYPYDEDWSDFWDTDDTYDAYYTQGENKGLLLPGVVDIFDSNAYGYQLTPNPQAVVPANNNGIQIRLKSANGSQIAPSFYYPFVIEDGCGNGASCYRDRISGCSVMDIGVGTTLTNEPGNMVGPTRQGAQDLIAQDPLASWGMDATYPRGIIQGGMGMASPRLGMVPTFDAEIYMQGQLTGRLDLVVTGIVGVFFEGMVGNEVVAHISPMVFHPTPTNLTSDTSSFLRTVILVR